MLQVLRTCLDIEGLFTRATDEVMVVGAAALLVSSRLSGEFHGMQPTVAQQCLDVPVDRGDSQRRHQMLARGQYLVGAEGSAFTGENLANGSALLGIAFHTLDG